MSRRQRLNEYGQEHPSVFGLEHMTVERPLTVSRETIAELESAINREDREGLLGDPRSRLQEAAETFKFQLIGTERVLQAACVLVTNELRRDPELAKACTRELSSAHAAAGRLIGLIELLHGRRYMPPLVSFADCATLVSQGGYREPL